jgi:hypothetical protein
MSDRHDTVKTPSWCGRMPHRHHRHTPSIGVTVTVIGDGEQVTGRCGILIPHREAGGANSPSQAADTTRIRGARP